MPPHLCPLRGENCCPIEGHFNRPFATGAAFFGTGGRNPTDSLAEFIGIGSTTFLKVKFEKSANQYKYPQETGQIGVNLTFSAHRRNLTVEDELFQTANTGCHANMTLVQRLTARSVNSNIKIYRVFNDAPI